MINVGGDNHAAAGNFVPKQLGSEFLAVRDILHVFRDHASAGIMHLGEIAVGVGGFAVGDPFGARLGGPRYVVAVSVVAISVVAVGGRRHGFPLGKR